MILLEHTSPRLSYSSSLSPPTSPLTSAPSSATSHFVQALHDYLPTSAPTEETVSCLYFKKGSIIEVFNRDDSGWWDGQSGDMRGWFPSNYVGRIGDARRISADFDDDYSTEQLELWRQRVNTTYGISDTDQNEYYNNQNSNRYSYNELHHIHSMELLVPPTLLKEINERAIQLVESCFQSLISNIQASIFSVVSSVRSILLETYTVNKESPLLRMYPDVAKQRKSILSTLSKLVLKGKELQQQIQMQADNEHNDSSNNTEIDQISEYADQLLYEIDIFQRVLKSIPRQSSSAITESTVSTTRSSMFYSDTPRSSFTSQDRSSMISAGGISIRQIINDTRHSKSSSSLISKTVHTYDIEEILRNILDQQTTIDELMNGLMITLEKYMKNKQRVSELLEITRKAVESVRTFLATVEHVCSNLGEMDYSRSLSIVPEDPRLVSLMITKESVYRAITNLVTAIRGLTNPQDVYTGLRIDEKESTDNINYITMCCDNVVRTTNECACCVRTCLKAEDIDNLMRSNTDTNMSEYPDDNETHRSSQILNILGRKVTSLNAIQQYHEDIRLEQTYLRNNIDVSSDDTEAMVESLEVKSPIDIQNDTTQTPENHKENDKQIEEQKSRHRKSSSIDWSKIILGTSKISRVRSSVSDSTLKSTLHYFIKSNHPDDDTADIPRTKQKLRPRAASASHLDYLLTRELPPLPHAHPKYSLKVSDYPPSTTDATIEHGSSANTESDLGNESSSKTKESRRLSISSLQRSLSKSKQSSNDTLPEPTRIRRLPSWLSSGNTDKPKMKPSVEDVQPVKDDTENSFLKKYSMNSNEMIFNLEGDVTGATEEALVKRLTSHEKSPDLLFTRAFFYNFHLFTTPDRFLRLLIERFSLKPPSLNQREDVIWNSRILIPTRLRVYNVLKTWLESYFIYEQDACIEEMLHQFVKDEMSKAMPGPAKRMLELTKKTFDSKGVHSTGRKHNYNEARLVLQKTSTNTVHSSTIQGMSAISNLTVFDDQTDGLTEKYPTPIITKSLRNNLKRSVGSNQPIVHVQDIDQIELARQLTLIENNLFCQIRPNELIGQEFKKKIGVSAAIHVKSMIQRSTQITSWISDSILKETDPKRRAQVLKYWIKVGDACLQLNNYNTLMAIRSALDSTSIIRLKKTWEHLSSKYKMMWEPIHRATDSQRNFAEYRQRLKKTVAPCLPFLGVYLTDMTFIDDGNSDYRISPAGQKLINFDKYIKTTRVLNEIDQFQIPYKLLGVEEIHNYIIQTLESVEQDDQAFYNRSLQREPKEDEVDRILSILL